MASDGGSERAARISANETVFRLVNEKIEAINTAFAAVAGTFTVICECGQSDCDEQIQLDARAYEGVRAESTLFIVIPGHEIDEVEDVVDRREGYLVVRKRAVARTIAEATDPRS